MRYSLILILTVILTSANAQDPDTTQVKQEPTPQADQPRIIYYQTTSEDRDVNNRSAKSNKDQKRKEIKTLAGSMQHSGGFGAVTFRATDFKEKTMVLAGARGGWIINRTLGIGVEGHGIIPTARYEGLTDIPGVESIVFGGYGGMFLELIFFSNQVVHITFPVSAGAGWIGYINDYKSTVPGDPIYSELIDEDIFWYVEPGANLELNISRNVRLAFGVSQRFTQDLVLVRTEAQAFDHLNYYFTIKIGSF